LAKATISGILLGGNTSGPAKTGPGWAKARNVKEVTTPKFAPAPRRAQKRSGLRVLEQVKWREEARTISAERRTSFYIH
jgi:hypothetical protein